MHPSVALVSSSRREYAAFFLCTRRGMHAEHLASQPYSFWAAPDGFCAAANRISWLWTGGCVAKLIADPEVRGAEEESFLLLPVTGVRILVVPAPSPAADAIREGSAGVARCLCLSVGPEYLGQNPASKSFFRLFDFN